MKITFFEAGVEDASSLARLHEGLDVVFVEGKLSEETVEKASEAEVISVFIGSVVSKELVARMPKLRHVVTRSTGVDHIDLGALAERGVTLSYVPSYGARAVAEHAFALLLTISRRTYEAFEQIKEEGKFDVTRLQGFDLFGKTIGIIGTGRIGKNAARIARGFGMNILLTDMYPDVALASEVGGKYLALDELLGQADIISLHCPYTKENHHMLGREQFAKLKKGVTLINTARGALVDTEALVEALRDGTVAHAGLDVLEGEKDLKDEAALVLGDRAIDELRTVIANHVLVNNPKVLITPHIAFHSLEADAERLAVSVSNIKAFISGKEENLIKLV